MTVVARKMIPPSSRLSAMARPGLLHLLLRKTKTLPLYLKLGLHLSMCLGNLLLDPLVSRCLIFGQNFLFELFPKLLLLDGAQVFGLMDFEFLLELLFGGDLPCDSLLGLLYLPSNFLLLSQSTDREMPTTAGCHQMLGHLLEKTALGNFWLLDQAFLKEICPWQVLGIENLILTGRKSRYG